MTPVSLASASAITDKQKATCHKGVDGIDYNSNVLRIYDTVPYADNRTAYIARRDND